VNIPTGIFMAATLFVGTAAAAADIGLPKYVSGEEPGPYYSNASKPIQSYKRFAAYDAAREEFQNLLVDIQEHNFDKHCAFNGFDPSVDNGSLVGRVFPCIKVAGYRAVLTDGGAVALFKISGAEMVHLTFLVSRKGMIKSLVDFEDVRRSFELAPPETE
jgi:hypothetical protein